MPNKSLQGKASKPSVRGIGYVHLFCTPLTGKHASIHTCLRTHLVPCIKSFSLNNRAGERKGQIVAEPPIKTSGAWHLPPRPGLDQPGCPPSQLIACKTSRDTLQSYSYDVICSSRALHGFIHVWIYRRHYDPDNKCHPAFRCMENFRLGLWKSIGAGWRKALGLKMLPPAGIKTTLTCEKYHSSHWGKGFQHRTSKNNRNNTKRD